jgi:hypothetical protein
MMVLLVIMVMMVAVSAIGAPFRLKRGMDLCKIRSETTEHVFDDMVGSNAEDVVSNLRRQMAISQMPGKACKLVRIFVPDFDNGFGGGLDSEPSPVFQLQAVPIGHGNRFAKIEKNLFALIGSQANAAPMAGVEIQRERTCCLFRWPLACRSMDGSTMSESTLCSHNQYMK